MVTPEQIERYRSDGLLVIDGVLSGDQIEHGRRIVDAFTEQSRDVPSSSDVYDLEPGHSAARPMIRRLKSPVRLDPSFDQLIRVGLTAAGADDGSARHRDANRAPSYDFARVDAWPLMGVADLTVYNRQILRGEATHAVRVATVSARIPLPLPSAAGTIFEMQLGAREKAFTTNRDQPAVWAPPR